VPEAGSSFLLPYIAGYQRAAELFLLARPFDAQKAAAAGFVTEIVSEAELFDRARDAALALAALPPTAVRATKSLMRQRFGARTLEAMEAEGRVFREQLASPEAREAMTAFFEKRKPDFSRF
jgi:enoyl-CoA hydratase/carnithine racemase